MATDHGGRVDSGTPGTEAYISPAADFLVLAGFALAFALAGAAVIMP